MMMITISPIIVWLALPVLTTGKDSTTYLTGLAGATGAASFGKKMADSPSKEEESRTAAEQSSSPHRRSQEQLPQSHICVSYSKVFGQELGGVCVCNSTSCHTLPPIPATFDRAQEAVMFTTSKAGKRFEPHILRVQEHSIFQDNRRNMALRDNLLSLLVASSSNGTTVFDADLMMDLSTRRNWFASRGQTIMGFGGTWTDATINNIYRMKDNIQEDILEAYYGSSGLQYSLARVPMASNDFSESIYSYNDDHVDDFNMTYFSIDRDLPPLSNKIPLIQRVLQLALSSSGRNVTIFASPWAPPTWMTTENTYVNGILKGYPYGAADNSDSLYWRAWALYFSKFITAYANHGIKVSAITVQNEPASWTEGRQWNLYQGRKFQSLLMNATSQRDFVKNELGPRLRQDHPDVMIIVGDDQKSALENWTNTVLSDPDAYAYISGVAFHWYESLDFVLDRIRRDPGSFGTIEKHHLRYPGVFLLQTEACEGPAAFPPGFGTGPGVRINETNIIWQRAENYARDILGNLLSYTVGWTDWNMVLNLKGGYAWEGKGVDSPILADVAGGEEWYKQPMYYIMGHFSKYVLPGAIRLIPPLLSIPRGNRDKKDKIQMAAFWVANATMATGSAMEAAVVIVLQNRHQVGPRRFRVRIAWRRASNSTTTAAFGGRQEVVLTTVRGFLDPDSVSTLLIPMPTSASFD